MSLHGGYEHFLCEWFNVNEYHPSLSQNNHQKRQINHLFILMKIVTVHYTSGGTYTFFRVFLAKNLIYVTIQILSFISEKFHTLRVFQNNFT